MISWAKTGGETSSVVEAARDDPCGMDSVAANTVAAVAAATAAPAAVCAVAFVAPVFLVVVKGETA